MKTKKHLFFILIITAAACSENDITNSTFEDIDFLGAVGTSRSYIETEKWLKTDSDLPYFSVPHEFIDQVALNNEELSQGICVVRNFMTEVNSINDELYINWSLSLPVESYLQITASGEVYSLAEEIDSLSNGVNYDQAVYNPEREIYIKDDFGIRSVHPPDEEDRQGVTSYIMNNIVVGDTWTREKIYETGTSNVISKTAAEVVGLETVTVPAGTFSAYKIKLTTHETNVNIWDDGYEYFVPGVGLVLKESDKFYAWDDPDTGERNIVRRIRKQELTGYNFKKN